jgi:hypothetical protein
MLITRIYSIFCVLLFLLASFTVSYAQAGFESEEELKKKAKQYFTQNNYVEALPLFSQLLSNYPKDPEYNYKYGACMLFVVENKNEALRYLEFAAARPNVDPEAIFYLGKGYHLNYRFQEAIDKYNEFKTKASPKIHPNYLVDEHIQMCNNGLKLLRNITDLLVLDKKTLNEADFFRTYNLSSYGGRLIIKPEDFQLAADKKSEDNFIMYVGQNSDTVFYSSYGDKGKTGKDIYFSKRLPDGSWGQPQNIGSTINTNYDEDYPFFNPKTNTLYFASTGHNSMGGYDVFKSTLDPYSGTWTTPVNLDFAINTPDNDFLYITDAEEKTAFFASTRTSPKGEVTVYNVNVERIPVDFAIIKGEFIAENTKKAKITVENAKTGNVEGVFSSNDNNGQYILTIPNGGSYKFIVETDKSPVAYTGNVEIPKQKTAKPLKQEISLVVENGYEKLIIKNLFDQEVSSEEVFLSADFLKNKANLSVNSDKAEKEEIIEETEKSEEIVVEKVPTLSNQDIIKMAYDDAEDIQKEANEIKDKMNVAYKISNDKNQQAREKLSEAEDFMAEANQSPSEEEKAILIKQAKEAQDLSKSLAKEAVMAYNLANKLEEKYNSKETESKLALQYALEMDNAVNSSSPEELAKTFEKIQTLLADNKLNQKNDDVLTTISEEFKEQQKLADKQIQKAISLNQQADILEKDIAKMKARANSVKDKTEKEVLMEEVAELENDLISIRKKEKEAMELAQTLQKEVESLALDGNTLTEVVQQISQTNKSELATLSDDEKKQLSGNIASINADVTTKSLNIEVAEQTTKQTTTKTTTTEPLVSVTEKTTAETKTTTTQTTTTDIPSDYNSYFEQQEQSLSSISNENERQAAQVKLYSSWQNSINEEIASKEAQLQTSKDATERALIAQEIEELKYRSDIKEEQLVALGYTPTAETTTTSSTQVAEQTTKQTTTKTTTTEPLVSVTEKTTAETKTTTTKTTTTDIPSDYNSYFEQQEQSLSSISNENERQAAQVKLYSSWQNSINEEIASKEAQLQTSKDATERALIKQEIEELKYRSDIKEEQLVALGYTPTAETTTTSSTQVGEQTTKQTTATEPLVSVTEKTTAETKTTTTQTTTKDIPSDYNSYFEQQEQSLSSISNENERQAAQVKLYSSWQNSINEEITSKEAQLQTSKDATERELIKQEIEELKYRSDIKEEQLVALGYTPTAETTTTSSTQVAEQTTKQTTTKTTTTEPLVSVTEKTTAETKTTTTKTTTTDIPSDYNSYFEQQEQSLSSISNENERQAKSSNVRQHK